MGARTANAWSPLDFEKERRTSETNWLADLRALEGWCSWIRSDRYSGARLLRALKTNKRILKSILYLTGSQWSAESTGVIRSRFFIPVRRRIAAFWPSCRWLSSDCLMPVYKELQQSKWDVIKARWGTVLSKVFASFCICAVIEIGIFKNLFAPFSSSDKAIQERSSF